MQVNAEKRALGLKTKIPDIKKTLEMVQFLRNRKVGPFPSPGTWDHADERFRQEDTEPLETAFELNDTLYAKAFVPKPGEVYLWLGVCFTISIRAWGQGINGSLFRPMSCSPIP